MKKKKREMNVPGLYRDKDSIQVGRLDFHVLEDGTEVYYLKPTESCTCSFYYRPRDGRFYVGVTEFTTRLVGCRSETKAPRLLKILSLSGRVSDKPVIILNYPGMGTNGYKNVTYDLHRIQMALKGIFVCGNIQFFELVVKTIFGLEMQGGDYCVFREKDIGAGSNLVGRPYLYNRSTIHQYFISSDTPSQYLIDLNRNVNDIAFFKYCTGFIPSPIYLLVKHSSIRDASKAIFGVSSKLAVKSLTSVTNAPILQLFYCLKGLVSWDHIIPYLPFLSSTRSVFFCIPYVSRRLLK